MSDDFTRFWSIEGEARKSSGASPRFRLKGGALVREFRDLRESLMSESELSLSALAPLHACCSVSQS